MSATTATTGTTGPRATRHVRVLADLVPGTRTRDLVLVLAATALLVIAGSADPIVPSEGSRDIAERAGSADKQAIIYEAHVHELINEPLEDREKVTQDIVDWLLARTTRS